MISIRCSQLDQIFACPASVVAPAIRIESDSQPARLGTGVHRLMSQRISGQEVDVAAVAKSLSLDADELGMTFGMTWNAWKTVEEWFPLPEVDFAMPIYREEYGDDVQRVTLTGTADVRSLVPGRKLIRIGDFKTGLLDRSCENQLRGYAWLDIDAAESEDIGGAEQWKVQTVAIRPRTGTVEVSEEMTYAELRAWWHGIERSIVVESLTYRPSPSACRYCRRAHECPARQQLVRSSSEAVLAVNVAELTPDRAAELLQRARLVAKAAEDAVDIVRAEVAAAGGSLSLSDGRTLQLTPTRKRSIKTAEAWPILTKRCGEQLVEAVTVSKTIADKIVRSRAGGKRGAKKEASEKLIADLEAADAFDERIDERLEIVRATAAIESPAITEETPS